jgi:hypothetical protein
MAGAGYKLFNTGDVLTAAQVNTYLNEQTVMVFASSAARTSALSGVLAEGMVSYLQDTNAVEVYNGSAWVGVSGAGDVTEVQAGTGISVASGTGPIPVVTNTMATAIDAEGDLIIGDAADAFQRLAIGSNTHVLTVDTSVDGKIKWAAPAGGGGKILQVIQATTTSTTATSSATFVDTALSASITPSLATSKVLVLYTQDTRIASVSASHNDIGGQTRLVRGATQLLAEFNGPTMYLGGLSPSGTEARGCVTLAYLDSPSTTSATTYKPQIKVNYTTTSYEAIQFQTLILMEVGA